MSKPDFAGVVTGDWHLDRFNRIEDFARCVDFIIQKSLDKKSALEAVYGKSVPFTFTHTGDGYKTWHPAPIEMHVMHRTSRLRERGIDGEIIVGNHDWPESEDHRGMHCFMEMKTLGGALNVIDEPTRRTVVADVVTDAHGVVVSSRPVANYIMIPHLPKAVLQRAGLSYRDYFKKVMNELIAEVHADKVLVNLPIILFTHCYIKEAAVGTSDLVVESDRQISVEDLRDPRLLAVFLGDIHKAQKLSDNPLVLYPGSIDRIDFGEAKDAKGIAYFEVRGRDIKVEFIATPAREFRHIVVDLTPGAIQEEVSFGKAPVDPSEIQPWIEKCLADYKLDGTIVKLTIRCGPNQKDMVDDRKLSELIVGLGADRVRSVNYDVVTQDQRRAPEITESLSPVAALERWVATQGYPPITAESVIVAGKKLIGHGV